MLEGFQTAYWLNITFLGAADHLMWDASESDGMGNTVAEDNNATKERTSAVAGSYAPIPLKRDELMVPSVFKPFESQLFLWEVILGHVVLL